MTDKKLSNLNKEKVIIKKPTFLLCERVVSGDL